MGITGTKTMRSFHSSRRRLLAVALTACFAEAVPVQAMPTGPQIAAGTAGFSQSGSALTINSSHNAILNWQRFNIAAGESVRFNQPSASSSVLNRVLGGDPSQLLGQLSSNGRVWLVNPAGILVGPGARIDTAAFVASTLAVRNEDFLAGRLSFQNTPGAGSVTNQGSISTPEGGSVYLVAPNVGNEGIINTPQGETILAAGQTVEFVDTATPGVKVEVTGAVGNVTNLGSLAAEAGRIGMVGVLVKNSGHINASSVVNEGGRIFLKASKDTYVDGQAALDANGIKGGHVEVLGERVALADAAQINASGQQGGGTVLVGGDRQGLNPDIQNARATFVGNDVVIKADALGRGDGGKVIVWADDTTRVHGAISARGGDDGKGGFVETSGHYLDTAGIDLKLGRNGTWLLDPYNMTVGASDISASVGPNFTPTASGSTVAASTINALLDGGTSVIVDTTGAGAEVGDITVNTAITKVNGTDATLTLKAHDDIFVNAGITSTAGKLNVVLQADQAGSAPNGMVTIGNSVNVITNGGDFTASGKLMNLQGSVSAGSGLAWLYPGGTGQAIDLGAVPDSTFALSANELNTITAATLRIGATTAGALNISAAINPTNTSVLSLVSGGNVTQSAAGTITVNSLAIKALGSVTLGTLFNPVTSIAAQLGDGANLNRDFAFKSTLPLNVAANIDGVSGISASLNGSFNAGSPDGVIALTSSGALTQSAGATLASKAVYAEGSQVVLTNPNPTGVIAGMATGGNSMDSFSYVSSNAIAVTTVSGHAGISAAGGPVVLQTTSNITLAAPVSSAAASGTAVTLVTSSSFANSGGGISLTGASSPRWLVYAAGPASVTKGGLTSAFRHYSASYATYPTPTEPGNGFIYASAPSNLLVDTTLASGAASHIFGAAPTAAYSYSISNAASADAEDLALIAGTPSFSPTISSVTPAGAYTVAYAGGLTSPAGYGFAAGLGLAYTVSPAVLSVIAASLTGTASKTYDGTTTAVLTPANFVLSGFVGTDSATVTRNTGSYADKNVGSGILVTTTLTGNDFAPIGNTNLGNYTVPTSASGYIGTITPAMLTISGVAASDKVYDATTLASIDTHNAVVAGVIPGDVVALVGGKGSFADKNVGVQKSVSISDIVLGGADAGNYALANNTASASASITPATIATVGGIVALDKVYDATTQATLDTSQAVFNGQFAGDELKVASSSGKFADKNVGNQKAVTIAGIVLGGTDGGNYLLADPTASASASITPATIGSVGGIVALDKAFDATTQATLDAGQAVFNGRFADDELKVASASGRFSDPSAGNGKTVDIQGITLSGADAGNYTLAKDTAVALASIEPLATTKLGDPVQLAIDQVVNSIDSTTQPQQIDRVAVVPPPLGAALMAAARTQPASLVRRTIGGRTGEFGGSSLRGTAATAAARSPNARSALGGDGEEGDAGRVGSEDRQDDANGESARPLPQCN